MKEHLNAAPIPSEKSSESGLTMAPPPFQLLASAADGNAGSQRAQSLDESGSSLEAGVEVLPGEVKVPFEERAKPGNHYMPFCDFIALLRKEEARYPKEAQNLPMMITRLRRIFYGTSGWEDFLIPRRKEVPTRYESVPKEKREEEIDLGWQSTRTYQDPPDVYYKQEGKKDEKLELMQPFKGQKDIYPQEVQLPNGQLVDIGHVLAGLDALNYPSAVGLPLGIGPMVEDNAAAATWIGDLGSAVAETVMQHFKGAGPVDDQITPAQIQAQVDALAPARDMRGNLDAYVIASHFDTMSVGQMTVTDILESYYLSSNQKQFKPYTTFADAIGLGFLKQGGGGDAENKWINDAAEQVSQAAEQYVLLQLESKVDQAAVVASRIHRIGNFWELSERLLVGMINYIHGKIIQESKQG